MQTRYEDFEKHGTEVVAISSSRVENHLWVATKMDVQFPILADTEGTTIRDYGLLHPDAIPGFKRPVARPAALLVDQKGILRARFLTENWRVRERPDHLLAEIAKLD